MNYWIDFIYVAHDVDKYKVAQKCEHNFSIRFGVLTQVGQRVTESIWNQSEPSDRLLKEENDIGSCNERYVEVKTAQFASSFISDDTHQINRLVEEKFNHC